MAIILSAPQVSENFSDRAQPGTSDGAKVFDFREEIRRQKRKRVWTVSMLAAGGMLLGTAIGIVGINWSSFAARAQEAPRHTFAVCGLVRRTCVVDGDTIWLEGVKIRIRPGLSQGSRPRMHRRVLRWPSSQGRSMKAGVLARTMSSGLQGSGRFPTRHARPGSAMSSRALWLPALPAS